MNLPFTSVPYGFQEREHQAARRIGRRDLWAARIVYQDDQGRRVDLHALRVTFGTNLVLSGAHPRAAQELMRHSDIRLTMKIYTDASKLPLAEGVAALPSFGDRRVLRKLHLEIR